LCGVAFFLWVAVFFLVVAAVGLLWTACLAVCVLVLAEPPHAASAMAATIVVASVRFI
jgi:hypothetical protein